VVEFLVYTGGLNPPAFGIESSNLSGDTIRETGKMRSPYTRIHDFLIKYKQVPYDDRYYFVYYGGTQVAKIKSCYFFLLERLCLSPNDPPPRCWDRFVSRVYQYNTFLNEQDT
jgi:hypothetical protein